MPRKYDAHKDELEGVAQRLRDERPQASPLELDRIKTTAMARAKAGTRVARAGARRLAVAGLTVGLLAATTGGVLAGEAATSNRQRQVQVRQQLRPTPSTAGMNIQTPAAATGNDNGTQLRKQRLQRKQLHHTTINETNTTTTTTSPTTTTRPRSRSPASRQRPAAPFWQRRRPRKRRPAASA